MAESKKAPISMPISETGRRQIERFRAAIERAGLLIEEADETQWRVRRGSREVLYFPLEDRWREGSRWGRGTLTLIDLLAGGRGN